MAFDAGDIEGKLLLDRSQWNKELKEAQKQADDFEKKKRTAKIGLELDTKKAEADLKKFQNTLNKNKAVKATLELDVDKASADLKKFLSGFKKDLTGLKKDAKLELSVDTKRARADMRTFISGMKRDLANVRSSRVSLSLDTQKARSDLGGFISKLKTDLTGIKDQRYSIQLHTDQAHSEIARLKAALQDLANVSIVPHVQAGPTVNEQRGPDDERATFGVDMDSGAAQAQADTLAEALRRTVTFGVNLDTGMATAQADSWFAAQSGRSLNWTADVDNSGALTGLQGIQEEQERTGQGFGDVGEAASGGMGTIATYAAIGAAALGPVSAALVGIPGLLFAMVGPGAAVAVGLNGIKAAASGLQPEFQAMQQAVSGTFERGLIPAIENTARIMPVLQSGLQENAVSLSNMATGITNVIASGEGLENLNTIFLNTAANTQAAIPAIGILFDNILQLGTVGTESLIGLSAGMLQVGTQWDTVIDTMLSTGSAQQAIDGLFQVLTALMGVLPPLVQLGTDIMAVLGPPLAAAVSVVGGALQVLADIFSMLPGPIQGTIVAIAALKIAMAFLNKGSAIERNANAIATAMGRVGPAVGPATAGMTAFGAATTTAGTKTGGFKSALTSLTGGLAGLGVAAAVGGLTIFGDAMAKNTTDALATRQAIDGFAEALNNSGGVLDTTTAQLVRNRVEALGLGGALNTAGVSTQQLASYLMTSDAGLETVSNRMLSTGNNADLMNAGFTRAGVALQDGSVKGEVMGRAMEMLGGIFGITGTGAGDNANKLQQLNKEFDAGAVAGKALSDAQAVLAQNIATTGQRTNTAAQETAAWAAVTTAMVDPTKSLADVTTAAASAFGMASSEARNMAAASGASVGALQDFKAVVSEINPAIIDSKGNIDLWADGGLEMQSAALQAASGIDTLFAATLASSGSMAEAGAKAAVARQQFIEMGVAAGVPREKMQALADTMMAIPKDVKTQVSMPGGPEAVIQAMGLSDSIISIPDSKTVIMEAPTAEAIAALEALGLKVETLPDGKVKITTDDAQFTAGLQTILDSVAGKVATLGVTSEDRGATPMADTIKLGIDAMVATLGINAEDRGANSIGQGISDWVDSLTPALGVNAEDRGAKAFSDEMKAAIDATTPVMGIDAADRGAQGAANDIKAIIDAMMGTEGVDAEDRGALASAQAVVAEINRMVATITVIAEVQGALNTAAAAANNIFGAEGMILPAAGGLIRTEDGGYVSPSFYNNTSAKYKAANGGPGMVKAEDGKFVPSSFYDNVSPAYAAAQGSSGGATSIGLSLKPMDQGAVADVALMSQGGLGSTGRLLKGLTKLTKMSANAARMIPPNTWRVVGDRSMNPEAFIPINRSHRSRSLLEQAASMMGYMAIDMRSSTGRMFQKMLEQQQNGGYQRPPGIPEGQQGWNTSDYGRDNRNTVDDKTWSSIRREIDRRNDGGFDVDKLIRAITSAMQSRTVESLTVQAPQGASIKEVVDEAMFRIRHARKGVHH